MLLKRWWWAVRAARKLRGYEPKRVTLGSLLRWSKQFPRESRGEILRLAANLEMVSEQQAIDALVALNRQVIEALGADGVTQQNVIYITTDTAGSSSGAMLDLLRRWANLERKGASFLHAGEGEQIHRKTMELGVGANNLCGRLRWHRQAVCTNPPSSGGIHCWGILGVSFGAMHL